MKPEYILTTILLLLLAMTSSIAQGTQTIELKQGKNTITTESFFYPTYVSTLIKTYPQIETITLIEEEQTKGYVNALGGIGKDFLIEQGKTYEIIVRETLNITLQ